MKKQTGFTLIELIMVIVILGILAAFALPRFADLGGDAREAVLRGGEGSVKSAAAIAHAAWLASGGSPTSVLLEGASITMSSDGYPTADEYGIMAAAQLGSEFSITSGTDSAKDPATITLASQASLDVNNDGSSGECSFVYNPKTGKTSDLKTGDC